MSFWDDVTGAAHAVLHSAEDVGKAAGGLIAAPFAPALDLGVAATQDIMPGGKSASWGDVIDSIVSREKNLLDPSVRVGKALAHAATPVLDGLGFAFQEGVDRPLSSAEINITHAFQGGGPGALLSPQDWAKSWEIAKHQNLAQSMYYGAGQAHDPFADYQPGQTPYDAHYAHSLLANAATTAGEFAIGWVADPLVVAGKLAQANRLRRTTLTGAEAAYAGEMFGASPRQFLDDTKRIDTAQHKVSALLGYINGENKIGRPLNENEISKSIRALGATATSNSSAISAALVEARKAGTPAEIALRQRQVLAVAAGDVGMIHNLQAGVEADRNVADILDNAIRGEGPMDLKASALNDAIATDPTRFGDFARQLDNADHDGAITQMAKDWHTQLEARIAKNSALLDTSGRMTQMPQLAVGTRVGLGDAGRLKAVTQTRLIDKTAKAHQAVDDWARSFAQKGADQTLIQRGIHQVPITLARTVGLPLSVWTRGPAAIMNAGRQVHFTGVVDTNLWDDAVDQFDSKLRIAHASPEVRNQVLSRARQASTEPQKMAMSHYVDAQALKALSAHYVRRKGISEIDGHTIDGAFLDKLIANNADNYARRVMAMRGSAYAAGDQAMPDDLKPLFAGGVDRLNREREQAQRLNDEYRLFGRPQGANADAFSNWRIDHIIDDDGNLIAVPMMSSQLANKIPTMDVNLAKRIMFSEGGHDHMAELGRAWRRSASERDGFAKVMANAKGAAYEAAAAGYHARGQAMEALEDAGRRAMYVWKASVLLRLGYPMRVLTDDHMRIAATLGYAAFIKENAPEAFRNAWHNSRLTPGGTNADVDTAWRHLLSERESIAAHGITAEHTKRDVEMIQNAHRILSVKNPAPEDAEAARALLAKKDPEGLIGDYFHHQFAGRRLQSSLSGVRADITKKTAKIADLGDSNPEKVAELRDKIAKQEKKAAGLQAKIQVHSDYMGDGATDPLDMVARRDQINSYISSPRSYRKGVRQDSKRHLGSESVYVQTPDGEKIALAGSMAGPAGAPYRAEVSSADSFGHQGALEGSVNVQRQMRAGAYKTYRPEDEAEHMEAWDHVLNRQIRSAPDAMFWVAHPDATHEEWMQWLRQPENQHLLDRMNSRSPFLYGQTLKQVVDSYIPTEAVRSKLLDGQVSQKWLDENVPMEIRPMVHGQEVQTHTARSPFGKYVDNTLGRAFRWLSMAPTDTLSRQPLFNALYKQNLRSIAEREMRYAKDTGTELTSADYARWERTARKNSLNTVKKTLWDISAHSHLAHVLRFISPFLAAHQEALTRWWKIVADNPAALPHFQQLWDGLRSTGLVYDSSTGKQVTPHSKGWDLGVTQNDRVVLRVPFLGENSGVNGWLKKLGGDQFFSFSENGLNVVTQQGITQPGVGPLVSVPLMALANHERSDADLQKVLNFVSGYPANGYLAQIEPAWMQKAAALIKGPGGTKLWASTMAKTNADYLTDFIVAHDRMPNAAEYADIRRQASQRATLNLAMQFASNVVGYTPVRPEGEHAAIWNIYQRLRDQADQNGKDQQWVMDRFVEKVGNPQLDVLIQSQSTNPAHLTGTDAEVGAIGKYGKLLSRLGEPATADIVIGPYTAMQGKAANAYDQGARNMLGNKQMTPGGDTWISQKTPQQAGVDAMVQDGWRVYDELNTALQNKADEEGLTSYTDDPNLVAARNASIAQLKQMNTYWGDALNSGSSFDKKIDDMRTIVNTKSLTSDPKRGDIRLLKTYLEARDQVTNLLAQRKAAGYSGSITNPENADLSNALYGVVTQLNQQNTYFETYAYGHQLVYDPYLKPALTAAGVE